MGTTVATMINATDRDTKQGGVVNYYMTVSLNPL